MQLKNVLIGLVLTWVILRLLLAGSDAVVAGFPGYVQLYWFAVVAVVAVVAWRKYPRG